MHLNTDATAQLKLKTVKIPRTKVSARHCVHPTEIMDFEEVNEDTKSGIHDVGLFLHGVFFRKLNL